MSAFASGIFNRSLIEIPTGNKGEKLAYSGILKSEKAGVAANLGYDPTYTQVFTFRMVDPPQILGSLIPGSLVRVLEGSERIKGKTLKVLSIPTRPIDLSEVIGTKITLILEDRNYLGSQAPLV